MLKGKAFAGLETPPNNQLFDRVAQYSRASQSPLLRRRLEIKEQVAPAAPQINFNFPPEILSLLRPAAPPAPMAAPNVLVPPPNMSNIARPDVDPATSKTSAFSLSPHLPPHLGQLILPHYKSVLHTNMSTENPAKSCQPSHFLLDPGDWSSVFSTRANIELWATSWHAALHLDLEPRNPDMIGCNSISNWIVPPIVTACLARTYVHFICIQWDWEFVDKLVKALEVTLTDSAKNHEDDEPVLSAALLAGAAVATTFINKALVGDYILLGAVLHPAVCIAFFQARGRWSKGWFSARWTSLSISASLLQIIRLQSREKVDLGNNNIFIILLTEGSRSQLVAHIGLGLTCSRM
ncbi:hypothetical protein B0H13DRAFT_1858931 [Mycena leptocephala]|nr:hypothetical protein B0H13DRAFT_1858931 [Mycena leptocephala]